MDRLDDAAAGAEAAVTLAADPSPLPAALAGQFFVDGIDGIRIACYEWSTAPVGAPALLWGHANGFNAGCYAPVLARLAERFRVFAFDARGHGASQKPSGEPSHDFAMDRLAEDLRYIVAAVRRRIGADSVLHYASHSMGGNAALLLEGRFGEAPFRTLTLFEPPIHPPTGHDGHRTAWTSTAVLANWADRRPERFATREAFREQARKIGTFVNFTPEMLDAYVAAAVHETEAGDFALFCPGRVEAAFYRHCPPSGIFDSLARVETPALVFSSDPSVVDAAHVWTPDVMRDAAAAMENGRYKVMPGCRHLMLQEDPSGCVEQVFEHTGVRA